MLAPPLTIHLNCDIFHNRRGGASMEVCHERYGTDHDAERFHSRHVDEPVVLATAPGALGTAEEARWTSPAKSVPARAGTTTSKSRSATRWSVANLKT